MSNEREAYIKFFRDRYQADPVAVCTGSEGLVVFQAGAEWQRSQQSAPAGYVMIGHQYQCRDGEWKSFVDHKHYLNTKVDGTWPIRAIYAATPKAEQPVDQALMDAITTGTGFTQVGADGSVKRIAPEEWREQPPVQEPVVAMGSRGVGAMSEVIKCFPCEIQDSEELWVSETDYDQLKEKLWHSEMAAEAEAHRVDELKAERDTIRKQLDEARELLTSWRLHSPEHVAAWLEKTK